MKSLWFADPRDERKLVIDRYGYTQDNALVDIAFHKDIMKGWVLSAPANTREEAVMITDQVNQPRDNDQ